MCFYYSKYIFMLLYFPFKLKLNLGGLFKVLYQNKYCSLLYFSFCEFTYEKMFSPSKIVTIVLNENTKSNCERKRHFDYVKETLQSNRHLKTLKFCLSQILRMLQRGQYYIFSKKQGYQHGLPRLQNILPN